MRATLLFSLLAAALAVSGCAPRLPEAPPAYPGFDTRQYPGTATMQTWREASPYRWVGYYLPAPCRRDTSWVGKRQELERLGWGMAALYVGQQTFEGVPDAEEEPEVILCSRTLLTTEQGERDGRDAVAWMAAEGFPPGSVVFLNIERMETVPWNMVQYYRAWLETVLEDGRYVPGTYAHVRNAETLFGHARPAFIEAGREDLPPFWVAGASGFTLDARPVESGLPYAEVWQGVLDVERTWGGVSLSIDENVAARPSPSDPLPPPAPRPQS